MARLLVHWADHPRGREKDWKRFDIGHVMPDGHVWGNLEGFPTYLRLDLPGITVEQVNSLIDYEGDLTGYMDPETGRLIDTRYYRAWHVVENRINPPILAALTAAYESNTPYVVSNPDGMLAWLEKKIDGSGKGSW